MKTINRVRCRWCGNTILYMALRTAAPYWYHKKSGEAQCRYKRRVATPRLDTPPELLFQAGLDRVLKKAGGGIPEVVTQTTYRLLLVPIDLKLNSQPLQLPDWSECLGIGITSAETRMGLILKCKCGTFGEELPRLRPYTLRCLFPDEVWTERSDEPPWECVGNYFSQVYFLRRQP